MFIDIRFNEKVVPNAKTHFKQMETFQCKHLTSCHPLRVEMDLSKDKPWESYEQIPLKQRLRKLSFKFKNNKNRRNVRLKHKLIQNNVPFWKTVRNQKKEYHF